MPKKRSHGDGALYYIKSRGLWRGVIDLEPVPGGPDRPQKYVHSKSQSECRAKLKKVQAEIAEYGAPLDNNVTVATWAQTWLEDHKKPHVDPHTYSVYASGIKRWIAPTIGHKKVAAIKPSDILAVHKAMRSAGRKSGTIRSVHHAMSMMFEQARRERLCAKNIVEDVDPPAKKGGTRDSLPLESAARLLEISAAADVGSMWWFKLLGGPRQTELLGATLDSLDLVNGIYSVNWSLESVPKEHGCGEHRATGWPCGKLRAHACPEARWRIPDDYEFQPLEGEGHWCLTRPKSQTGRVVPLIPQLQVMIADYLNRHADEPNPHGLIWRNPDGSPIKPKEDAQAWRDLLHQTGLITAEQAAPGKSPIDGHWARHTTITLLASLGVDFQLIGEIVGQASAEVTAIYRHANNAEKAHAMERLGDLMLAKPKAIES